MIGLLAAVVSLSQARAGELSVEFQGRSVALPKAAVFALPGETLEFTVEPGKADGAITMGGTIGSLAARHPNRWRWSAPSTTGSYGTLQIVDRSEPDRRIDLAVFVLVPAVRVANGYVGKFRIDAYPRGRPAKQPQSYSPPIGFVEVTEANRDLHVSPNFRIGQFVSKQLGDWPKYVVPSDRLYVKLEWMLEAVRRAGFDAETLHVMSGYRTPFYNRALGNVAFSRHIYGDAADVFVDIDGDDYMDDLNRDGVVDVADAMTLARWLETLTSQPAYSPLTGGLGIYDATEHHGPFIHLDARGHRARWGRQPR